MLNFPDLRYIVGGFDEPGAGVAACQYDLQLVGLCRQKVQKKLFLKKTRADGIDQFVAKKHVIILPGGLFGDGPELFLDRKSTRLNSSHS